MDGPSMVRGWINKIDEAELTEPEQPLKFGGVDDISFEATEQDCAVDVIKEFEFIAKRVVRLPRIEG
jgi:hypothetical protein